MKGSLVMKISSTELFTGFIFTAILWKAKTDDHPCHMYIDKRNLLHADCSNRTLKKVPQDLNQMTTALDMSENRIENFDAFTFKAYPKFIHLRMTKLLPLEGKDYIPHDETMFAPLTLLLDLDISYSRFTDHPKFEWPLKLEKLALAGDKISELDLTMLAHLKQLDASNNIMKEFPKFNLTAPIYWIDLSGNPLNNVTAEHLAPFCQLEYLGLQIGRGGLINHPSFFCHCLRLEKWMLEKTIEGAHTFFCFNDTHGPKEPCNLTFDSNITKQYEQCLLALPASPLENLFIYLMLFSFIFPVLYIANIAYQKYKERRERAKELLVSQPPSPDPSLTVDGTEVEMNESQSDSVGSQYNAQ